MTDEIKRLVANQQDEWARHNDTRAKLRDTEYDLDTAHQQRDKTKAEIKQLEESTELIMATIAKALSGEELSDYESGIVLAARVAEVRAERDASLEKMEFLKEYVCPDCFPNGYDNGKPGFYPCVRHNGCEHGWPSNSTLFEGWDNTWEHQKKRADKAEAERDAVIVERDALKAELKEYKNCEKMVNSLSQMSVATGSDIKSIWGELSVIPDIKMNAIKIHAELAAIRADLQVRNCEPPNGEKILAYYRGEERIGKYCETDGNFYFAGAYIHWKQLDGWIRLSGLLSHIQLAEGGE